MLSRHRGRHPIFVSFHTPEGIRGARQPTAELLRRWYSRLDI